MLCYLKIKYFITWAYIHAWVFLYQVVLGLYYGLVLLEIEPELFGLDILANLIIDYAAEVEERNFELLDKIMALLDPSDPNLF